MSCLRRAGGMSNTVSRQQWVHTGEQQLLNIDGSAVRKDLREMARALQGRRIQLPAGL